MRDGLCNNGMQVMQFNEVLKHIASMRRLALLDLHAALAERLRRLALLDLRQRGRPASRFRPALVRRCTVALLRVYQQLR